MRIATFFLLVAFSAAVHPCDGKGGLSWSNYLLDVSAVSSTGTTCTDFTVLVQKTVAGEPGKLLDALTLEVAHTEGRHLFSAQLEMDEQMEGLYIARFCLAQAQIENARLGLVLKHAGSLELTDEGGIVFAFNGCSDKVMVPVQTLWDKSEGHASRQ